MSDTLNMFGRYAITAAISFAVGRGWITPSASSVVADFAIQALGMIVAFIPALYAAKKIDNSPK